MDTYPENGILPGIEDRVFQDHVLNSSDTFLEETAGFAEHPAQMMNDNKHNSDTPSLLMERMGVSDADGFKISGRTSIASALKNLIPYRVPDVVLHHSSYAVPEYSNPDLMPGMFPTLFPFGIGGFEHPLREPKVSFQAHANALLDVPEKSFRQHQSFIFVALNIMQRRLSHLHTHFTVRKSNFDSIATKLTSLSSDVLVRLADHLESEGTSHTLTEVERDALTLLNHVNTISAQIPGSQSAKIFTRNEIRSYFLEFGLPQLYFTFNPSVTHNPIFQVMVGDESVDLTTQFPFVVPSKERALRLAQDPVAAADFFEFCVTSIFEHLFGWNYVTRKSNEKGGILGHLRSFYGTCEFTERGSLHGHFLIWLLGGLNPNEIHRRLKDDAEFEHRFFSYFEDIIQHHLPDVDVLIDAAYEPRVERPPIPPSSKKMSSHDLYEWRSFMETEVKKLGELLQRHKCKPVCHKYGNDDKCRFFFPHDVELTSHFERETNSVVLKCLDSMVNYFNRYILIYCRHNHDIKCILSGKAAKAAMCYITDYITKMDMKTYQMLSLLSRAVASVPQEPETSVKQKGRMLLHKCLSQFTRQQQIHAQQAARYLRGKNDTISSHETCPLMSGLLLDFVFAEYKLSIDDCISSDNEDDDVEHTFLKIQKDHAGNLINHNQLTDYWFRPNSLSDMNFYDFTRCITLQKKRKEDGNDFSFTTKFERLGVQIKHCLLPNHPLAKSHHLLQHTNDLTGQTGKQFVPRIIGSNIPRKHSDKQWMIFTLAHFKPFDHCHPLIDRESSIEETYRSFSFSQRSQTIMQNWEDIHECEDERDKERMRKRSAITAESLAMSDTINRTFPNIDHNDVDIILNSKKIAHKDFIVLQTIHALEQSQWLTSLNFRDHTTITKSYVPSYPTPSTQQFKEWKNSVKIQENIIARRRQTGDVLQHLQQNSVIEKTECYEDVASTTNRFLNVENCRPTTVNNDIVFNNSSISSEDVINDIGEKQNLQSQQWIAFRIIARSFITTYVEKKNALHKEPLRMFLTGPGGTGKTHVVKAVQKVMEFYGAGHTIRFLAPTGSAASLIDGMTIHKGLGIKVQSSNKGKGNRKLGEHQEDYSVIISIQNKVKLRDEWRCVEIVLIDECSLLSAELLSEIDAALRFAKERPNEWFGGVIVIFAGDLYQYPPVCATPLYNSIPKHGKPSSVQLAKRLGRLAWKSINAVISFTEQKRMKDDIEYATAVTHLRTRECTITDLELFNTRIIKSAGYEHGIDMSNNDNFYATAIVRTNLLRETMNIRKAETNAFKNNICLTNCAAVDTCITKDLTKKQHEYLLHLDMSSSKIKDALPGFLPLYVGMPVVLKNRNISTDLGITNGCQGNIRHYYTNMMTITKQPYCICILVEFPESKVDIPGLPLHYFPIVPVKTTFTTQITTDNAEKITIKISRSQLPIQPAFAVTGHSAEGKTLPKVLTNLNEGGFGAYVAASRARSRHGLYITEPISLNDLNKPIPYNLLQESNRLNVIEHNTYIQYGFRHGPFQTPKDPESEQNITHTTLVANFFENPSTPKSSITKKNTSSSSNDSKRKRENSPTPAASILDDSSNKKQKKKDISVTSSFTSSTNNFNQPLSAGCTWSAIDWSCAYDCALMSIFYAYLSFNDTIKSKWRKQTSLTNLLTPLFQELTGSHENMMSPILFNKIRDYLRDYLSDSDPIQFHRHGPIGAPVEHIFDYLINKQSSQFLIHCNCSSPVCTTTTLDEYIPTIFFSSLWSSWCEEISNTNDYHTATTQNWLDLSIETKTKRHNMSSNINSTSNNISTNCELYVHDPPPLLMFEISPDTTPKHIPNNTLTLKTSNTFITYHLRSIIYYGQFHFTARLFDELQHAWSYDSQKNEGIPLSDNSWNNSNRSNLDYLTTLQGRYAHIYIYGL